MDITSVYCEAGNEFIDLVQMNFLFFSVGPEAASKAVQFLYGGTRWRSWLRHCATSRKFAGSISDGATGILH